MGLPKALLDLDGISFLERAIRALAGGGCDPVLVVVGSGPEHEVAADVATGLGATVVRNPDPESEQIGSLRLALRRIPPEAEGVMVMPVDLPLVSASLVDALIGALRGSGAAMALPAAGDRHGHPVLFARPLLPELLEEDLPEGARTVVHRHLRDAVQVPVEPDTLRDVDTPGELRWIRQR